MAATPAGYTPAQSPLALRHDTQGPGSPAAFSRGSSLARERESSMGPDAQKNRVLRIKRFVGGEWKTEIVRDAAVINAYVKRRQAIEEENTTADALAPTGDAEKDRRAKKRYGRSGLMYCPVLVFSYFIFNLGWRKRSRE